MEWMKTCCRLNMVFLCLVFTLVLIQVAFLLRIDLEVDLSSEDGLMVSVVNKYASRYVDNLAFTFIPILLLVNISREFDYAVVHRSLVSGISRGRYFNGKLLQLGLFALFAFLLAFTFHLLTAVIYDMQVVWDFRRMAMYSVVAICLGSLALMIAFILKKRFYALTVFVAYVLLENTLTAIIADKTLLLPFQTCIRILKYGIYQPSEFIMAGAYTGIFVAIARQVFGQTDLK
jgi:hypothetical protein